MVNIRVIYRYIQQHKNGASTRINFKLNLYLLINSLNINCVASVVSQLLIAV